MGEYDFYTSERKRAQYGEMESISSYTAKTFLWMFLGLLTTFVVAWVGYRSNLVLWALGSIPAFHILILVAEVAVVLVLSSRIQKLRVATARCLFFAYAVLNGVVFSTYFLLFDRQILMVAFGATALYFGVLAAYGYFAKVDLSRIRPILIGGLIFLIVAGFLSLFLPMGGMDRIVCLAGIAIFLGFTAYDTQKIKAYHAIYASDPDLAKKASIFAALELYLDFINLFLYLIRFLGKREK